MDIHSLGSKFIDYGGGDDCKVYKNKACTYAIAWADDDYLLVLIINEERENYVIYFIKNMESL